jgi:DedD protein
MGTSATPEASEIRRRGRQRLLGAVAIALILIVFVPMLLDSEPRPARDDKALTIPPKDSAPPLPAPLPSTPPPQSPQPSATPTPAAPKAATETKASSEAKASAESKSPPAAKVAVVEPKGDLAKPETSKAAPAAPVRQGFAVQVGAFRDDAKLAQAREKLQAAKVAHYTEPAGGLTRLRAGPYPTKEAAEKAAANIRKTIPDAKVVPLP